MMDIWRRSIGAGFLIGLASALYVYVGSSNPILAAFLFAFALFFVCLLALDLFTGKIGWFFTAGHSWTYYVQILAGNLFGTLGAALICLWARWDLKEMASALIDAKSAVHYGPLFARAMLCGVMMYLAVVCWRRAKGMMSVIGIFLCVPIFILCGFEHSIADAGYMFLALRLDFLVRLLVIAAGNALGSVMTFAVMEAEWKYPSAD